MGIIRLMAEITKVLAQGVSTSLMYGSISVNVDFLNVFVPGIVPAIPADLLGGDWF